MHPVRGQLIKRYFLTGLLIWVPLVITGWVLSFIVSTLDQSLRLLPEAIHPQRLFGFAIPGAGALLTLADEDLSVDFGALTQPSDRVAVVATQPLTTGEAWQAIAPGELKVFVDGTAV